jgi:hypothetical protein
MLSARGAGMLYEKSRAKTFGRGGERTSVGKEVKKMVRSKLHK